MHAGGHLLDIDLVVTGPQTMTARFQPVFAFLFRIANRHLLVVDQHGNLVIACIDHDFAVVGLDVDDRGEEQGRCHARGGHKKPFESASTGNRRGSKRPERVGHFSWSLIALRRVLRHHPIEDACQPGRNIAAQLCQRLGRSLPMRCEFVQHRAVWERSVAGQQIVQRTPETVDIRPNVGLARVVRLLRGDVVRRAH